MPITPHSNNDDGDELTLGLDTYVSILKQKQKKPSMPTIVCLYVDDES